MLWLLLAASLLLVLVVLPFAYGYLVATLVWMTPFLKWKVKLARFLIARPVRMIDVMLSYEVAQEVEWIVRMRHGPKLERELYPELLERAWHHEHGVH